MFGPMLQRTQVEQTWCKANLCHPLPLSCPSLRCQSSSKRTLQRDLVDVMDAMSNILAVLTCAAAHVLLLDSALACLM